VLETLLGTSIVFGTLAVCWMDARGVLTFAVRGRAESGQPGNEVWEAIGRHVQPRMAYGAPVIVLIVMALIWWLAVRKNLFGAYTHIQRGTPEGQRPWHATNLPTLFPFGAPLPPEQGTAEQPSGESRSS
jgi:hypothetical protein